MTRRVRSIATGSRPPTPSWNGASRNWRSRSDALTTATTEPMRTAWTIAISLGSAKKSMNTKITLAAKNNTIHSGTGMTPTAPWTRSFRAASRSDVWSSHLPYAASSVGPSGDSVWRVLEQLGAPRVDLVAERAGLHPVPLRAGDGAGVADELARQLRLGRLRQELRGLELLRHDERLGLGALARLVVAREGEEHDEAEEHGEAGRQHAEHAGGPVAVGEEPLLGRPAAHEEHRGDTDG